jgi:succinate-semialdehyde dehydrogenase/glutarate-semialdehyde dehydrogenase
MENLVDTSPIKTVNPFNNEIVKQFDVMEEKEVNEKIELANTTFKSWKKVPFAQRAAILHKVAAIMRKTKQQLGKLATL